MEMPNNISKAFKQILEDFSDTPLHEATTKVKSETLQVLVPFAQWFDLQQNILIEFSSSSFPEGKTKFSAKDFNKFYTEINLHLQSDDFRSSTMDLAGRYKSVDKSIVFQILTNLCFNLQNDILREINDRSEKNIPNILEKISLEKDLQSSARGKIRYVSGFVIASLKRQNSKVLRNALFAPGKQDTVNNTKRNIELLDSMCSTYSELHQTTTDPESLVETKRKQNISEGLCNITDSCFDFFMKLEEQCRYLQSFEYLYTFRTDMYVEIEKTLLENNDLFKQFINIIGISNTFYLEHETGQSEIGEVTLCDSLCTLCENINSLLKSIICLFVKVSMSQFRRDFLSDLKVEKSKALRKKVLEKSKTKSKHLDLEFLQKDDSENKQAFHLRLKSELLQGLEVLDKQFKKADLIKLCHAYDIKIADTKKKGEFVEALSEKILKCESVPYPQLLHTLNKVSVTVTSSTEQPGPSSYTTQPAPSSDNEQPGPSISTERSGPSSYITQPAPSSDNEQPGPSSRVEHHESTEEQCGPSTRRRVSRG